MRPDEIQLQIAKLITGHANGGEITEAGVDAVYGVPGFDHLLDSLPAALHRGAGFGRQ